MAYEQSLEETPTWAVAVVCFVLVFVSIIIEHVIHLIGAYLKKRHKIALYEALEKVKAELMLMGFLSFLLTVLKGPISDICIPKKVSATWHPCQKTEPKTESNDNGRKLLEFSDSYTSARRSLAGESRTCEDRGMAPFVSSYGIHQLHIFIFVLAIFHIFYCITTLLLGSTKMRRWKAWEEETKTIEHQYYNDPERFRFARDTSFGRRHLNNWSRSQVSLWIVCFFRQFFTSVTKVDYLTLRHGFITAHLAPESETKFDFRKYISRSLEEDFKVVVGITPIIWFFAVLFLLSNTYGWYSYLWLPFIPLIIILMVGAKLQLIITKLGLRIQERGGVVKGAPVVEPGDDLFWFGRPRLLLFLIHFVLFQNAFQIAFFIWSTYEFGLRSCYHEKLEDIIIRISLGVIIQVLCSYVTLPLYALVTQMGSTMKPTIFNERVAAALKSWHHTAKKHTKHGSTTPNTSRPATPTHGMSPVHLLHKYGGMDSLNFTMSPRRSNVDNDQWDGVGLGSSHNLEAYDDSQHDGNYVPVEEEIPNQEESSTQLSPRPRPIRTQHEVNIPLADFSFRK